MQDVLLRRDGIDSNISLTMSFQNPEDDFTFTNGSGDSNIVFADYSAV